MPPPAYRIIATSNHADNTITRSKSNAYYIEDDSIGLENSEGNCQTVKIIKYTAS